VRSSIHPRKTLPFLIPPAGVALAMASGDLVATLVTGAAFAAAHVVTIPDRAGRRLSLSPMVAIAALLLTDGAFQVVLAGGAIGMPLGWWVVSTMRGERSLDHLFPAEPLALGLSSAAFLGVHLLLSRAGQIGDLGDAVATGVAAIIWYATAALSRALGAASRRRISGRVLWWQALRDAPSYAALFSAGAMFGFAWDAMSWWALPVALLPYAFSHVSLSRVSTTTRTYRQTMVALSRIPEAGGLVGHGRGERTGALAAEVGAEIRLSPTEVDRVEYAGLLHDVGRVVFNDPTVAEAGYSDSDVAAWGAAIIQESPSLTRVAQLVADQYKPYRRAGEARNELVPRAAQVVRVSAAYDRTLHEEGRTVTEALEELHRGAAYDFDPEVVAALRRVLQRRDVAGA